MIPQKALEYIKQKKLKPAFSYKDVWNEEHITSFTIAKVMQIDILKDMKDAVEKAIANGETLSQFKKNLLPTLYQKGWSGKQIIKDDKTGEDVEVYIDAPHRLKTIYETNLRSAYMKGRFDRSYESDAHPYLMYRVGPSKVHRPEHLAFDGLILDKNDKFWLSHNPPNGWGCKCYTVAVSKARKERYEKEGIPGDCPLEASNPESMPLTIKIKAKTVSPKISYKTYINKRNGTISKVPGVCPHVASGVDPSFNFNRRLPAGSEGNYSRDLVLFDDFMRKGKKDFPERFENIAETILRNEIKKEQFESFIEKAFENDNNSKNITAVGFISSAISKYLKNKIGIDIGESVTVGLEARLLNGIKAKRHALKNEALEKSDADYILKCLLYGDVYFQKNNKNLLYLYKVGEDRYLQIALNPQFSRLAKGSYLRIPLIRNIKFIDEKQKISKYNSTNWEKIK